MKILLLMVNKDSLGEYHMPDNLKDNIDNELLNSYADMLDEDIRYAVTSISYECSQLKAIAIEAGDRQTEKTADRIINSCYRMLRMSEYKGMVLDGSGSEVIGRKIIETKSFFGEFISEVKKRISKRCELKAERNCETFIFVDREIFKYSLLLAVRRLVEYGSESITLTSKLKGSHFEVYLLSNTRLDTGLDMLLQEEVAKSDSEFIRACEVLSGKLNGNIKVSKKEIVISVPVCTGDKFESARKEIPEGIFSLFNIMLGDLVEM